VDLDQHLALAGRGALDFLVAKDIRVSGLVYHHGFHERLLLAGTGAEGAPRVRGMRLRSRTEAIWPLRECGVTVAVRSFTAGGPPDQQKTGMYGCGSAFVGFA
jgi:hypothetical protein